MEAADTGVPQSSGYPGCATTPEPVIPNTRSTPPKGEALGSSLLNRLQIAPGQDGSEPSNTEATKRREVEMLSFPGRFPETEQLNCLPQKEAHM